MFVKRKVDSDVSKDSIIHLISQASINIFSFIVYAKILNVLLSCYVQYVFLLVALVFILQYIT